MEKSDFMVYLQYLKKTLDIRVPVDKEVLDAWYKPFKNINLEIGKEMAKLYLQKEHGYFSIAKLLDYKDLAMKGRTHFEATGNCELCGNTGFVQIEDLPYEPLCRRCMCPRGDSVASYVRQIKKEDLPLLKVVSLRLYKIERVKNE